VLFSFDYNDGALPIAGPTMDPSGNLYGTTPGGGANSGGTVYQLTPGSGGWQETVLHSFYLSTYGHPAPGGSGPYAGLILDASSNLYGTTRRGGKQDSGVVFELSRTSSQWKETVLHSFNDNGKLLGKDGLIPGWGALAMDASGALYGTTSQGGENICYGGNAGCGTIFKLTKGASGGWKESVLYYFKSGATGSGPNAGVVIDSAGNLYGSTDYGGSECGCGVIYKLSPGPKGKWKYAVLHTFDGPDGALPEGNLVLDSKGNLYGGAILGGAYGYGVVFELTP